MNDILSKIIFFKKKEIFVSKKNTPLDLLKDCIKNMDPPRGFLKKIEDQVTKKRFSLIGEIKQASPSKGLIRKNFDPSYLSLAYEKGGASCLSVLTDQNFFQGSLKFLNSARSSSSLPILRKDFIFDVYQIYESRAWGADCILIILSILDDKLANKLEEEAMNLGMDVLIETHNIIEIKRALKMKSKLIGINNRDLKNFNVNLKISEDLAKLIPNNKLVVSESGIKSYMDLQKLRKSGINCFLVGESLMKKENIETATKNLLNL